MLNKEYILNNKQKEDTQKNRGLYFLINDDEIVYVGKSEYDVFTRIEYHKRNSDKEFNSFYYKRVENRKVNLDTLETKYIAKFTPKYNKIISDHNNFTQLANMKERNLDVKNQRLKLDAFIINNKLYVNHLNFIEKLGVK